MMQPVWVEAIGILGPGLEGWSAARAVLRGEAAYVATPPAIPSPSIIPPRDQRRCSNTVRLALHVAQQTIQAAGFDATATPSVFAYTAGDGQVVHRLLTALSKPDKPVSPTDFHNSVHNAPAFYWALGTGCQQASSSISAARHCFAAALLKAASQCLVDATPALMVCFDYPLPEPLAASYPLLAPLAIGLALSPSRTSRSLARLELDWDTGTNAEAERPMAEDLHALWSGNPAGHGLPLLELIARAHSQELRLPGSPDAVLKVQVSCTA
jgi:Beta-ketoacyl synthase, N-terminal domain